MKKAVLLLFAVFLVTSVSASVKQVQYDLYATPEKTDLNASVQVTCDYYCTGLNWKLPSNTSVIDVKTGLGDVEYTVKGDSVSIQGQRSQGRETTTYKIIMRSEEDAEEIHKGLYKRKLSLPGFSGRPTTGFVGAENMISGWVPYGFDYSFTEHEMRFKGSGPVTIRVNFGEGRKTTYYQLFGDSRGNEDQSYKVAVGTLGIVQTFQRFPVAVLPTGKYNRTVNQWSSGEYVAGSIRIRAGLEEDFYPILAHETVHGLNDRKLTWDGTQSTYFDEGTAEYIEFLVRKKIYRQGEINVGPGEIFGQPKEYRVKERGKTYIYTVPSEGSRDVLWNYYQQGADFMKSWNPHDYPDYRTFGYAYSELIVKNYVANMNGSFREIYSDMGFSQQVNDRNVKWAFYNQYLDMTPCKYESRERFNQCLDRINNYDYSIYVASPEIGEGSLNISRIELPEREQVKPDQNGSKGGLTSFIQGIIDYILSLF